MNALPIAEKYAQPRRYKRSVPGRQWRCRLQTIISMMVVFGFGFGVAACSEKATPPMPVSAPPISGAALEPATQVLGVVPAGPTRDSAASTSATKSDMTPAQQSTEMPLPGQANDHSVMVPKPAQKPASR